MTDKHQGERLADIAKRYPEGFLSCRDTGHTWAPREAAWLADGTIERVLACSQCDAQRVQVLDANGYLVGSRYLYSEGYSLVGIGRLDTGDRALLRKTHLMRQLG